MKPLGANKSAVVSLPSFAKALIPTPANAENHKRKSLIAPVVDAEKLSFYNQKLEWVAEAGEFELMVGASSEDIRLKADFSLTE